jgi:hypothetical protein
MALHLSLSKRSLNDIYYLGYSKVCVTWVPRSLTIKQKADRKAISSKLLVHFEAEGQAFYTHIVTAHDSWIHHLNRKQKGNSWNGAILILRERNNSNSINLQARSCLLPSGNVILVGMMPKGTIINSQHLYQYFERVQETF